MTYHQNKPQDDMPNDESRNADQALAESGTPSGLPQQDESTLIALVLIRELFQPPLFTLGQVAATPGAVDLLDRSGTNAAVLLQRHQCGDWGLVCEEDAQTNREAVRDGFRILSVYELGPENEQLWVITECDRSVTTLLLPQEY